MKYDIDFYYLVQNECLAADENLEFCQTDADEPFQLWDYSTGICAEGQNITFALEKLKGIAEKAGEMEKAEHLAAAKQAFLNLLRTVKHD